MKLLQLTNYRFLFFIIIFNFFETYTCAQKIETDSVINNKSISKDSTHEFSKIRKIYTKYLFKKRKTTSVVKTTPFDKVIQGKPIRNIYIQTNDPFGYSLQDTTVRPKKWIEKAGNSIHGKTKRFVIKELILFKKKENLDTVKLKESERLLRNQRILRRVEIIPKLSDNNDSVDVYINTIDSWSMIATGSVSTSKIGIRIRERNFLGLGHVFDNRFRHNYETGKNLYRFNYTVPNIAKTRILGNVNYFKNEDEYFNKSVSLTRPFYSPLAKWAGGITLGQNYFRDSLDYEIKDMDIHSFKYNFTDLWVAKAFRVSKASNINITNLIVSARYYERNYKESPNFLADPVNFFSDQKNYLVGVGLSSRHYVKENYIYNNGIDEDVAIGHTASLVGGFQDRPNLQRLYFGGKVSMGGYINTGYFGAEIEYGSYFNKGKSDQGTLDISTLYFSKLMNLGKWKIRQFSKLNYTVGFDRWNIIADELSLNEHDFEGMDGIRGARNLIGNQKLMVELQTQSYSPYEFLGFRISPFFNAALGVIGNTKGSFFEKDQVIARLGLGIMFTNDYFIFNNFQFSFSFYPKIPGEGSNIIKSNVIDNRDFMLMDFDFSKPNHVRWNRWD